MRGDHVSLRLVKSLFGRSGVVLAAASQSGSPKPKEQGVSLPKDFISKTIERVKPSPTIAATQKARDLQAAGRGGLEQERARAGLSLGHEPVAYLGAAADGFGMGARGEGQDQNGRGQGGGEDLNDTQGEPQLAGCRGGFVTHGGPPFGQDHLAL